MNVIVQSNSRTSSGPSAATGVNPFMANISPIPGTTPSVLNIPASLISSGSPPQAAPVKVANNSISMNENPIRGSVPAPTVVMSSITEPRISR